MLFSQLIRANLEIWDAYLHHDFVKKLENESLEREKFLFYLKQDYLFLIHYAKCYARLALNAQSARELRFAMKFQNSIIEGEIELHRSILNLGIKEDDIKNESIVNIAYTRYMLSIGESGDFLDMLVALSVCAIGYGLIGDQLFRRLGQKKLQSHLYKEWILTYSSKEFQNDIREFEDFLNSYTQEVSQSKFKKLSEIFYNVTRLENAFWQHCLSMQMDI